MEIDNYWVLCPYCKSKCGDHENFEDCGWDDAYLDFTCEECGKNFEGQRCITVDYRTEKDCEKNGEKHEPGEYHCKKCDDYNCVIKEKLASQEEST